SMRVVIVDGDVSYPPTSGKRLRTLNLMLRLADRHKITYVGRCAPESEEARIAPEFLRDHGIDAILVPHPVPKKAGVVFGASLAGNWFSSVPYSVASHYSPPMIEALRKIAAAETIDLWQFEWSPYMDFLDASIPGARLIIAHNVDSVLWQRYYETS